MAIHVAANTGCNLGCEYCYEEPDREMKQEQIDNEYDLDLILERLEKFREEYPEIMPGMHGGEPLLLPIEDLRTIYDWIDDNYNLTEGGKGSHIQTNGTLLRDEHIELFKDYNVSIGISMDGPKELNDSRIARSGGEDVTRKMTESTYETIEKIIETDDVNVGVITVLSKTNAGTDEKLEKLLDWMDYLNKNGVYGHYNPALPYEDIQEDLSLTPERLKEVYLRTWEWMKEEPEYRKWDPMRDYQRNLMGIQLGNCVVTKCDVYNASAAKIVRGDGGTSGCGKTWGEVGDGVPFLQGDSTDNEYGETEERYDMLRNIPGPYTEEVQNGELEDQGGCKGCRYWAVCQGGCPAGGSRYDYRNRVIWCEAIYGLYEKIEEDMRGVFPGIRLLTDAIGTGIEDVIQIADAARGIHSVQPFAAMRSSTAKSTKAHVSHVASTDEPSVEELVLRGLRFDTVEEKYEAYSTVLPEPAISKGEDDIEMDEHILDRYRHGDYEGMSDEEIRELEKDDETAGTEAHDCDEWQTPDELSVI